MRHSKKIAMRGISLVVALSICGLGGAAISASAEGASAEGDYAPQVHYTDDGVAYQLTPSETTENNRRLTTPDDQKPYNTYWLKADERGCESCHGNLGEFIVNMPSTTHLNIIGAVNDMTIDGCNYCHVGGSSSQPRPQQLGSIIHAAHPDQDCWTCHDANENGDGITLWDNVKYDRMTGFASVDAATLEAGASFEWNQDRITPVEDWFNVAWEISGNDYARSAALHGEIDTTLDEAIFENWTISITGDVANPGEYRLVDLIEQGYSTTEVICTQCVDNPIGGGLLGQVELTGIPLSAIIDIAGVDGATNYLFGASDGSTYYSLPIDMIETNDVILAYEVNGERIPMSHGYPLYAVIGGMEAYYSVMGVNSIDFSTESGAEHYSQVGLNYSNTPNIGNLDTVEGQIIPAGEPYTFGGYAYAYSNEITGIEFSLDRGETWVHYDIAGTDTNKWVSWEFTFTPEEGVDAAYLLYMRSVMADGTATVEPVKVLVNAKTDFEF